MKEKEIRRLRCGTTNMTLSGQIIIKIDKIRWLEMVSWLKLSPSLSLLTSSPVAMAASPTPRQAPCCTISFVPLFLRASERYEIVVESPAPPRGKGKGKVEVKGNRRVGKGKEEGNRRVGKGKEEGKGK